MKKNTNKINRTKELFDKIVEGVIILYLQVNLKIFKFSKNFII